MFEQAFKNIDNALRKEAGCTLMPKRTRREISQNARVLFESHLESTFAQVGKGWEEKRLGNIAQTQYGISEPLEKRNCWRLFTSASSQASLH